MPSTKQLLPLASVCLALVVLTAAPARPTPLDDGVQYLAATQQADGGWNSTRVRRSQAAAKPSSRSPR
jgi:hypothetical protein